jgi:hypothetical protein
VSVGIGVIDGIGNADIDGMGVGLGPGVCDGPAIGAWDWPGLGDPCGGSAEVSLHATKVSATSSAIANLMAEVFPNARSGKRKRASPCPRNAAT